MNLHALRLFYYVAETGSVTKASALLNISQPAVTSQIKKFEKELGLTLFNPSGRGISLTPFGTELAKQAGNLFTYEKRMEEFIEDYRQGRKGSCALPPPTFRLISWCRVGRPGSRPGIRGWRLRSQRRIRSRPLSNCRDVMRTSPSMGAGPRRSRRMWTGWSFWRMSCGS